MTTDRAGAALALGSVVAVLPRSTREDATVEDALLLGVEYYGAVVKVEGGYVTVVPDDASRGTVEVRSDLVLVR